MYNDNDYAQQLLVFVTSSSYMYIFSDVHVFLCMDAIILTNRQEYYGNGKHETYFQLSKSCLCASNCCL